LKIIIVASTNPVKIQSALLGFQHMFAGEKFLAEGVAAKSGVRAQPVGDAETLQGALSRASHARETAPQGDYWVGIEGGVVEDEGGMAAFAWVVVLNRSKSGRSRTGMFYLPREVAQLVRGGMELGHADDVVFGRSNSKQQDGSVGLLTGGVIDRTLYYEHAVVLALIPFRHPQFTF
jgi:inosine/xanthosine triphosphatase